LGFSLDRNETVFHSNTGYLFVMFDIGNPNALKILYLEYELV